MEKSRIHTHSHRRRGVASRRLLRSLFIYDVWRAVELADMFIGVIGEGPRGAACRCAPDAPADLRACASASAFADKPSTWRETPQRANRIRWLLLARSCDAAAELAPHCSSSPFGPPPPPCFGRTREKIGWRATASASRSGDFWREGGLEPRLPEKSTAALQLAGLRRPLGIAAHFPSVLLGGSLASFGIPAALFRRRELGDARQP